jgi:hypothetical protein
VYKNVLLTVGTGSYQTYKEGGDFVLPKNNDEFNISDKQVNHIVT